MKRNSKSDKVFQNAIEKIEDHRRTPGSLSPISWSA